MIETSGAPRGQGLDQGSVLGYQIRAHVRELRAGRDWLAWRRSLAVVHRTTGRELARFVPQLHERLEGMATAARISVAALELCEEQWRAAVRARFEDGVLFGALEADSPPLHVRRSAPDAGGFASIELTAAPLASAVCGVNSEGIGAACLDDARPHTASVRLLVQDVLFRTRTFVSALEHVRRRAPYFAASGSLLVCNAEGEASRLTLDAGAVTSNDFASSDPRPTSAGAGPSPEVRVDLVDRALEWNGKRHRVVD